MANTLEPRVISVFERTDPVHTGAVFRDDVPYPLDGCGLTFLVKPNENSDDENALFTYSIGNRINIVDVETGAFQIRFKHEDISSPGVFFYTLRLTMSNGTDQEVTAFGPFIVKNV